MELYHYSATPFEGYIPCQQEGGATFKPNGLWVSPEGEDGWESWCRSEGFRLGKLRYRTPVLVNFDKVAFISNSMLLDQFGDAYAGTPEWEPPDWEPPNSPRKYIDWKKVSVDYEGVVIVPYLYSRRLEGGAEWYYGWDCASGCLWGPDAVLRIGKSEIVE